jgi:hypothetical protein
MSQFTEKEWTQVIAHLAEVIGPDAQRYAEVPAARLLAAIPYLADSEDPDRFAVSNLLTFHAMTKARTLFDHRTSDDGDVFRRLATFHVGNKADPQVVDYGLTLLALISLNDHEHDAAADRAAGKYNPVNAGKWDTGAIRKELVATLDRSSGLNATFLAAVGMDVTNLTWWSH